MKVRIEKEKCSGFTKPVFKVYLDNEYHGCWYTKDEALAFIDEVKKNGKPQSEIIHEETI